jgi:hypothetical protein
MARCLGGRRVAAACIGAAIVLSAGAAAATQTLYKDEDGHELLLNLQGGLGGFGVGNADFGAGDINSSAPRTGAPPSQRRTDREWVEGFVKPSLEGRAPLWDYGSAYGLMSIVTTFTRGNGDAVSSLAPQGARSTTSDHPDHFTIEDAVLGWRSGTLLEDWAAGKDALDISGGDQSFVIGDAFLVGTGVANGFHRAALYFAPRTSFDRTILVRVNTSPVRARLFKLETHTDQDEMHGFDQPKTKLLGGTAEWFKASTETAGGTTVGEKEAAQAAQTTGETAEAQEEADLWSIGGTFLHVYEADSSGEFSFSPADPVEPVSIQANRQGLNVFSAHLGGSFLEFDRDILLYGQFVLERNDEPNRKVRANAWYIEPGYRFSALPWTPQINLRYAHFSGDRNPTDRVKRSYDPLFATGGPRGFGSWTLGEIYGNYLGSNSNIDVAMANLKVSPSDQLDLGAIFYDFYFDEVRQFNDPRISASHALDEVDLYAAWSPRSWMTVTGLVGVAVPGSGFKQAASAFVADNGPPGRATGKTMTLGELLLTFHY